MAARYWVGDTNPAVWNDTGHWSTSDGGAGGASVPSTGDDVYFTSSNTNDCTVDADISIKSLSIASGYTGTFDNATNDKNVTVSGDVTLDGTRVDMGDGTWTVSGDFDNKDVTTFNRNASTLVMDGTGKEIISGYAKYLYNFTIPTGATINVPSANYDVFIHGGQVIIEGELNIASGEQFSVFYFGDLKVAATGKITGAGTLRIGINGGISQQNGVIDVGTLSISLRHGVSQTIVPATYDSPTVLFNNSISTSYTFIFLSGTYTFTGNVTFQGNSSSTGTYTIDNSTNNPNFVFKGNVTVDNGYSELIWTKGTGTITVAGTSTQSLNFLGKTVEDINITNTSADVSITNDVTCDSLSASDNASIKVTAGKTITTDSVNDLGGSAGNLVTVASSSPGDVWYLIASGTPVVSYINVTDSDASGGSEINTVGSVDGGNNTNWVFAVIRDIIQAGIIIFKR